MAFIQMDIASGVLGKLVPLNVIMPQQNKGDAPVKCLYLLHGLSDDYTMWSRRTSIERFASRYPNLAIVMPDAQRSFYTDTAAGDNYYTFIAKELPEIMETMFNISDKREDRFIAGNSMGGYGSLKVALREDGRYGAVAALSPVSDVKSFIYPDNDWLNWESIFGKDFKDCDDVPTLARECKVRPKIYLAIGLNDFLYQNNVPVRKMFADLGYDFTYEEAPGDHCWDFWDIYIDKAIRWMMGY